MLRRDYARSSHNGQHPPQKKISAEGCFFEGGGEKACKGK